MVLASYSLNITKNKKYYFHKSYVANYHNRPLRGKKLKLLKTTKENLIFSADKASHYSDDLFHPVKKNFFHASIIKQG